MVAELTKHLTAEQLIGLIASDYPQYDQYGIESQRDKFMEICQSWLAFNKDSLTETTEKRKKYFIVTGVTKRDLKDFTQRLAVLESWHKGFAAGTSGNTGPDITIIDQCNKLIEGIKQNA